MAVVAAKLATTARYFYHTRVYIGRHEIFVVFLEEKITIEELNNEFK